MVTRARSFWFGLTLPIESARLIATRPKLLALSFIPLMLTLLIAVYVMGELRTLAQSLIASWFLSWGVQDGTFVAYLMSGVQWVVIVILGAILFLLLSSFVASPFNDFLAEGTEPLATPPLVSPRGISFFKQVKLMFIDLVKTLATAVATLITFFVALIPFLNFIALGITFLLVAFQFLSYPQTRRGLKLRQSFDFLWNHFYASLGFGMSISFLFSIPFLSVLALPIAVVGGTLLYARAQESAKLFALK